MTLKKPILLMFFSIVVLLFSYSYAVEISFNKNLQKISIDQLELKNKNSLKSSSAVYPALLKVHIVEPTSRWIAQDGINYNNGHLDYALFESFSIPTASVWDTTITWDGATNGFPTVTSGNIGAVVGLFNSVGVSRDAFPPNGFFFTAYLNDASASAYPGIIGQNETTAGFSHTVLIEEGTATW